VTYKAEYIKNTATLVSTAFAIAAAMAWNTLVTALFANVFGTTQGLVASFIYATIVTVIAVTAVIVLARAASKAAGEDVELKIK